ncbi:MAG: helix-turn-helix transcriptional regulator [Clostridia bacterium]|nr:helix-turn-helix transcriptional regulator [Clostridia bacterium]
MSALLIENTFYGKGETSFSYSYRPAPNPTEIEYNTHLHNSYEMLLFYEGDANYHIGGNVYYLTKNDLLIIKPSTYHNISLLSSHPYARIVLSFYKEDFSDDIVSILQNSSPFYHIPDGHPILQMFEAMRSASEILSHEAFELFFTSAINNILLLLPHINDTKSAEKNNSSSYSTFDKMLFYIDENPDKPLSLAWLSKTFFLSESHISHLFKTKLNTTAMQYINRKKISYAHSLLVSGIPPIQVAEKCSYKNYSTFFRMYKRFFGTTPKNHTK